jgi:hypothetical protein
MGAVEEAVVTSVKGWAQAIGLSADSIEGYSKQVEVSIGGLDAKGTKEAIDKAFSGIADDIAQINFGDFLLPLAKKGETLGATLQRLGTDLTTVNNILLGLDAPLFDASAKGVQDLEVLLASVGGLDKFTALSANLLSVNKALERLNQPLYDISVDGAKAATTLVASVGGLDKFNTLANDLLIVNQALEAMGLAALPVSMQGSAVAEELVRVAGGLDKFSSATGQYYQDMYSATEKAAVASASIDKAFSQLGQSTPKTKDEFRKLVEAQDLSTASGRKLALSIIALEPAFASVMNAAEQARKSALADVGVKSNDLSAIVKKGLMSGNLKGVGSEFTDKLLEGVQDNLYGKVADSIVNSITDNMIGPLLDSIIKGEPLDKALSSISLDNVKTQYKETVDNIAGIFNNAQVTSGIGQLRNAIIELFNVPVIKIDLGPQAGDSTRLVIGGDVSKNAEGGYISGPGTATSDSIPAMLSNGEFVVKASSVAKYGTRFLSALNAGDLNNTIYRAPGGPVGPMSTDEDTAQMLALMYGFVNNVAQSGYWQDGLIADSGAIPRANFSSLDSDAVSTYAKVLKALGETFTGTTLEIESATKGMDKLHKEMYREVEAGKELLSMRENLVQMTKDYASSEVELLKARGDARGAAVLQRSLDLQDIIAQKAVALNRLQEDSLSERERSYQTQIAATADLLIGQYDAKNRLQSQIAIQAAQDEATKRYIDATKQVAEAQKAYASALGASVKNLKDFLSSLDARASSGVSLQTLRGRFSELAGRAASGDTSAYDKLPQAAKSMLDASEKYSRTLQEYRRDEAAVRAVVSSVIGKAEAQIAALPADVSLAADPIKDAWKALQKATNEQANAATIMAAMGTDRVASEARINAAEDDLAAQYEAAIASSPDYDALKRAFDEKTAELIENGFLPDGYQDIFAFPPGVNANTLLDTRIDEILPRVLISPTTDIALMFSDRIDEAIPSDIAGQSTDFASILLNQVQAVLPEGFVGSKADLAQLLANQVNTILPADWAGTKADLSQMLSDQVVKALPPDWAGTKVDLAKLLATQVNTVLPEDFAGKAFNLSLVTSNRVTQDIFPTDFAGKTFNLASIATARVTQDILPTDFAGKTFNFAQMVSTQLGVVLTAGFAGASFNAAQMMQTAIDKAMASSSAALATSVSAVSTTTPTTTASASGYNDRAQLDARNVLNARISEAAGGITVSTRPIFFDRNGNPTTVWQKFDKGTSYVPYDMTAQIHHGEEITPRPYVDSQRKDREQTNALLAQLLRSNEDMRAELSQLRATSKDGAEQAKRTATLLTRVTRDGNSLLTTAA